MALVSNTRNVVGDLAGLTVDRSSALPVYAQMRQQLSALAADRRQAGIDSFFTDEEISRHFGVSRMTARQAVGELVRDGTLYRRKGVGTFIAPLKLVETEGPVGDFFGDWPIQGRRVEVEVPVYRQIKCPKPVAAILKVDPRERVLHFERRRSADGVPVALDERWVAPPASAHITADELRQRSIHLIVGPKLGLHTAKADVQIEAALCTPEQAALLDLEPNGPVLIRTVTTYSGQGRPLWTGRSVYRGDLYKYQVVVRAP